MPNPDLKQYVPQEVCLKCDGCCRYKEADSPWRPRVGLKERETALPEGLAAKILFKKRQDFPQRGEGNRNFLKQVLDPEGRLQTVCTQGQHFCSFFNADQNTCRIYAHRPFECQLYPFILTKYEGRPFCAVHLFCPHIEENRNTPAFDQYVSYLKNFFKTQAVMTFLDQNHNLFGDYTSYADELEYLFAIPVSFNDGDGLMTTAGAIPNEHKKVESGFPSETTNPKDEDGHGLVGLPLGNPIGVSEDLLHQKPRLEATLLITGQPISAFSFPQIFAWSDFFEFELKTIQDCLCLFARSAVGTFMYLPPLGAPITLKVLHACFAVMEERNHGRGVSRIENVPPKLLSYFPQDDFAVYKKCEEYCYDRQEIAGLKGNRYKSQRSDYNQFVRGYAYAFRPYEETMLKECLDLYEAWSHERAQKYTDEAYQHLLKENRLVHERLLQYHKDLGLIGRVVVIKGRIVAYTFGYPLNETTFCDLLEICDIRFRGLSVFTFREFCADPEVKSYTLINCMDDSGMENLRRAKMFYHPRHLIPVYVVTLLAFSLPKTLGKPV